MVCEYYQARCIIGIGFNDIHTVHVMGKKMAQSFASVIFVHGKQSFYLRYYRKEQELSFIEEMVEDCIESKDPVIQISIKDTRFVIRANQQYKV